MTSKSGRSAAPRGLRRRVADELSRVWERFDEHECGRVVDAGGDNSAVLRMSMRASERRTSFLRSYDRARFRDWQGHRHRVFRRTRPKPSKPSGSRSKTLTPTPEPAGYCAGDVAGERRDRAAIGALIRRNLFSLQPLEEIRYRRAAMTATSTPDVNWHDQRRDKRRLPPGAQLSNGHHGHAGCGLGHLRIGSGGHESRLSTSQ